MTWLAELSRGGSACSWCWCCTWCLWILTVMHLTCETNWILSFTAWEDGGLHTEPKYGLKLYGISVWWYAQFLCIISAVYFGFRIIFCLLKVIVDRRNGSENEKPLTANESMVEFGGPGGGTSVCTANRGRIGGTNEHRRLLGKAGEAVARPWLLLLKLVSDGKGYTRHVAAINVLWVELQCTFEGIHLPLVTALNIIL